MVIKEFVKKKKNKKTLYPSKIAPVDYEHEREETTQTPVTSIPATFIPAPGGYQGRVASNNMEDFFQKRTSEHVERVQKYLDRLEEHYPYKFDEPHDESKYEEPEHEAYLYITWKHKAKNEDKEYEIPEEWKDKCDEATFHHIKTNKHHPEYWDDSLTENPINKEDRDKPSGKVVDATKMPKKYVLEMVADWCAMSEELGGNPKKWADDNIGVRWEFSPEQKELIYEAIGLIWDKKKKASVKNFTKQAQAQPGELIQNIDTPQIEIDPTIKAEIEDAVQQILATDPSYFRGISKIVALHSGPFGQVSSEDPTVLYLNVERIKSEIKSRFGGFSPNNPEHREALEDAIKEALVEVIAHEKGHAIDWDPERGVFPGGEGVAEQESRRMLQRVFPASIRGFTKKAQLNPQRGDWLRLKYSPDEQGMFTGKTKDFDRVTHYQLLYNPVLPDEHGVMHHKNQPKNYHWIPEDQLEPVMPPIGPSKPSNPSNPSGGWGGGNVLAFCKQDQRLQETEEMRRALEHASEARPTMSTEEMEDIFGIDIESESTLRKKQAQYSSEITTEWQQLLKDVDGPPGKRVNLPTELPSLWQEILVRAYQEGGKELIEVFNTNKHTPNMALVVPYDRRQWMEVHGIAEDKGMFVTLTLGLGKIREMLEGNLDTVEYVNGAVLHEFKHLMDRYTKGKEWHKRTNQEHATYYDLPREAARFKDYPVDVQAYLSEQYAHISSETSAIAAEVAENVRSMKEQGYSYDKIKNTIPKRLISGRGQWKHTRRLDDLLNRLIDEAYHNNEISAGTIDRQIMATMQKEPWWKKILNWMRKKKSSTRKFTKKAKKLTIGLDIDGVLGDFHQMLLNLAEKHVEIPEEDRGKYSLKDMKSVGPELQDKIFEEAFNNKEIANIPIISGAVDTVNKWHDAGHKIVLLTARTKHWKEQTEDWLDKIGLKYDKLIFDEDKGERAKQEGVDLFIDDKPENVAEMQAYDIDAFLFSQPWNQDSDLPRIDSWRQFKMASGQHQFTCAWCGKKYGNAKIEDSHGICPECEKKLMAEFWEKRKPSSETKKFAASRWTTEEKNRLKKIYLKYRERDIPHHIIYKAAAELLGKSFYSVKQKLESMYDIDEELSGMKYEHWDKYKIDQMIQDMYRSGQPISRLSLPATLMYQITNHSLPKAETCGFSVYYDSFDHAVASNILAVGFEREGDILTEKPISTLDEALQYYRRREKQAHAWTPEEIITLFKDAHTAGLPLTYSFFKSHSDIYKPLLGVDRSLEGLRDSIARTGRTWADFVVEAAPEYVQLYNDHGRLRDSTEELRVQRFLELNNVPFRRATIADKIAVTDPELSELGYKHFVPDFFILDDLGNDRAIVEVFGSVADSGAANTSDVYREKKEAKQRFYQTLPLGFIAINNNADGIELSDQILLDKFADFIQG